MLLDGTCQPKTLFSLVPIGISAKNTFSAWFLSEFRQKTFFQPGSYWNFVKKHFFSLVPIGISLKKLFQPGSYWNFIKKHFFKLFPSELGQKSFLSVPHGTQPISFLPVPYETPHTFIKTNKKSKYLQ